MKKAVFIIGFSAIFVIGLWLVAIPASLIIDRIEGSLDRYDNLYIQTEGFKKGLFYNVMAERILLKKRDAGISDGSLLILDSINARLNIMSLLKLSPELDFDCKMSSGVVKGSVKLIGNRSLKLIGNEIQIDGIPFLELLGIHGDGNLSWSLWLNGGTGEAKFSVDSMRLKNTSVGGVPLPLEIFKNIKGVVVINKETIDVKSFALEGKGVYARLKGSITEYNLNLNMELMIDSSFESGNIFRAMLEQYKVSPGYYVIPVKTRYEHI